MALAGRSSQVLTCDELKKYKVKGKRLKEKEEQEGQ